MQNLAVIQTIEWIKSLFSEEAKRMIFDLGVFRPSARQESIGVKAILGLSNEFSRVSSVINASPDAVKVMYAFELQKILNEDFIVQTFESVLSEKSPQLHESLYPIGKAWDVMVESAQAWKKLTIPVALHSEEEKDNIISLELQYEGVNPQVSILAKAIEALELLYASITSAYQIKANEGLTIIKVDSGSNVRIDLRGAVQF